MKFSIAYVGLLSLFAPQAQGDPISSCEEQSNCLIWTQVKLDSQGPCGYTADCAIKVCMTLSFGGECVKKTDETISHICDASQTTDGCPGYLTGGALYLDGDGTCTIQDNGINGNGKCEKVGNGVSFCQIGYPGASLIFSVKDGDGPQDTQVLQQLPDTGATVMCQGGTVDKLSCGGNSIQQGKERIWTYTIPDNACSGGGGGGGGGGGSTCTLGLDTGMDQQCVVIDQTACTRTFTTDPCTSIPEPANTDDCYVGRFCNQGFCVTEYKGAGDACELSSQLTASYDDQCIESLGKCQSTGQNGATTCQVSSKP